MRSSGSESKQSNGDQLAPKFSARNFILRVSLSRSLSPSLLCVCVRAPACVCSSSSKNNIGTIPGKRRVCVYVCVCIRALKVAQTHTHVKETKTCTHTHTLYTQRNVYFFFCTSRKLYTDFNDGFVCVQKIITLGFRVLYFLLSLSSVSSLSFTA